jgi:uncharacterized protein
MNKKELFLEIGYFVVFVVASLFVSQFLALVALLPLHDFKLQELVLKMNDPLRYPEMKMQLLTIQGLSSFLSFVAAPMAFIIWKEKYWRSFLSSNSNSKFQLIGITILIMLVSMPFLSVVIEWNEHLVLPEPFAQWATEKEEFLKKLTQMLTTLNNPFELSVGLVVIALLPALGEELVFRGYLQNKFKMLFDNPHVAIWVSAFLFSAIHFQFYGFVPRMMLGAMFGYIYHATGQFHLPVLAHFTNNGLMLVMMYLKNHGHIQFDIESETQAPVLLSCISFSLTCFLFVLITRQLGKNSIKSVPFL